MARLLISLIFILVAIEASASGKVKVRIFSNQFPESAVFAVTDGTYEVNVFNGESIFLSEGDIAIISRFDGRLVLKVRKSKGLICDSIKFNGQTNDNSFSMRINGRSPVRQYYSGDLVCFPDLETILLVNICDIEKYIAGVVRAEGGSGKNLEYFKSQAVIARTYMYKYLDKHQTDGYNLCDNTHCQVFNGMSTDTILNKAALETSGQVILDKDSVLIISAFHSNCGGETASSENVWLSGQPYLKSVIDPYCINSRNAFWDSRMGIEEWTGVLKKYGFSGNTDDHSQFSFSQKARLTDYTAGSFTIPLRTLRTELNLRSAFFSVVPEGDTIKLSGRGYGHGVGLCQEGAMVMASKSFNYKQIIDFYYFNVMISDISKAINLPGNPPLISPKEGLIVSY